MSACWLYNCEIVCCCVALCADCCGCYIYSGDEEEQLGQAAFAMLSEDLQQQADSDDDSSDDG